MGAYFELSKLPVPPPSNHQYIPIVFKGQQRARLVPSTELKEFQARAQEWFKEHFLVIGKARQVCADWQLKGYQIGLEAHFFFPHSRVWTQDGRLKRFDVSNRLKALEDQISEMISVDDSAFFFSGCAKWETQKPEPWAHVILFPFKPGGFDGFKLHSDVLLDYLMGKWCDAHPLEEQRAQDHGPASVCGLR